MDNINLSVISEGFDVCYGVCFCDCVTAKDADIDNFQEWKKWCSSLLFNNCVGLASSPPPPAPKNNDPIFLFLCSLQ